MRFSLIAATFALALTANASQVNRREVGPNTSRCTSSLKAVSDYLPSFTSSIKKISSYTGVIDAHIKEDKLEKRIKKAIQNCSKVTSASEEATAAFIDIMQDLVANIQDVTGELIKKKEILSGIPLARPLLEDSLLTINSDTIYLEEHLIDVCPEKYKEDFRGYIVQVNGAMNNALVAFDIKEDTEENTEENTEEDTQN